ncbi:excinuclease ABC, A subunit [Plantactinospora veratri]|uniref:Excinuclease ABC, A subunit n=1 Tax=Plantactinospora veratri TaxID=1436122 RepID=A0ABU7SPE5_9ACTN
MIENPDGIIDLGPEDGSRGGTVLFEDTRADCSASSTRVAEHL